MVLLITIPPELVRRRDAQANGSNLAHKNHENTPPELPIDTKKVDFFNFQLECP